jgi:hypothetical protein
MLDMWVHISPDWRMGAERAKTTIIRMLHMWVISHLYVSRESKDDNHQDAAHVGYISPDWRM